MVSSVDTNKNYCKKMSLKDFNLSVMIYNLLIQSKKEGSDEILDPQRKS